METNQTQRTNQMITQILKITAKTVTIEIRERDQKPVRTTRITINSSKDLMKAIGWLHAQKDIKTILDTFRFDDKFYHNLRKNELMSSEQRKEKEEQAHVKWERYETTAEYRKQTKLNKQESAEFLKRIK